MMAGRVSINRIRRGRYCHESDDLIAGIAFSHNINIGAPETTMSLK